MVNNDVRGGLLESIDVGKDKVEVSLLQEADDTLFICPFKVENIKAIKYVLQTFEVLSKLGVNFNKSSLRDLMYSNNFFQGGRNCFIVRLKGVPYLIWG